MNKDLENEYRQLMMESVPDLWDRIEAELEPKQQKEPKAGFWRRYRTWGIAVAACLCLAVMVPVMLMGNDIGNSSMENSPISDNSDMGWLSATDGSSASGSAEAPAYNGSEGDGMWDAGEAPSIADADETPGITDIGQEPEGEIVMSYTLRILVLWVAEEEDRTAYAVSVEGSESADFLEGDVVFLYDDGALGEKLAEGEAYLLEVRAAVSESGEAEYFIEGIRYE